jgi:LmbE family N-acetylglucosaminyl deacetylase
MENRKQKMENKTKKNQFVIAGLLLCAVALAGLAQTVRAQGSAAWSNGQSLPEVIEAIEKARVTTRILYVTAHPDDEPGAVLAYLARGLHADVALLSLTRGEGGQNALGPEQAPQLGVLRTEELMNATRVYGTRLFFTRAADFGYTKTADEALQVWGDQTLEDMVRVIRTFRPHVIINSWGGVRSGHGQHQASGILTPQAYAMAADAKAFPKLMEEGLQPWKVEALLQLSRGNAPADGFSIPVSEISPLWGKSWGEIGVEGYLNHRTQGVGGVRSSPFFRRPITLVAVEGAKPDEALLGTPLSALSRHFPDLDDGGFASLMKKVDEPLAHAASSARTLDWKATTQEIARAARALEATPFDMGPQNGAAKEMAIQEIRGAMRRMDAALAIAAGIRIDAQAERSEVVAGESFTVTVNWLKRNDVPVEILGASLALPEGWSVTKEEKQPTGGVRFTVAIPKTKADERRLTDSKDNAETQRAQRSAEQGGWIYPWPAALVKARLKAKVGEHEFETETEVTATRVTSVSAETRPVMLVPAVTLTVEPKELVLVSGESVKSEIRNQKQTEREIVVRVRHYATAAEKITVGIDVPAGWSAPSPNGAGQTVEFTGAGDQLVRFIVKAPMKIAAGKYELKAYAKRADGEEFRTSLEPLVTLPTRMWSEPAVAHVHVMDVTVPKDLHVGYVTAENDPIPEALREIGVHVELLDEAALAFGDLSKYDAICVGIRAYELRQDLPRANPRLLDYAAAGGTLVVQYQRENVWNQLKPGPYPANVGAPPRVTEELSGARTTQQNLLGRVTDANSPVRFVDPKHSVLNFPNVIGPRDFEGWVQERGLYFFGQWDARYTPVLALRDPGEQEALGALVYARHGKGVYIYTGLSFFRQLPEGVPGAYRLFVNLLSQGKKK